MNAARARSVVRRTWIAAIALLVANTASAAAEHPALHWARGAEAESCIDPRSLAQRVQSITGPTLVSAALADVSIEARIEHKKPDVFTVYMRISPAGAAAGGERVLSFKTDDCRSLDATIAFLIAMAIDPELGAEGIPNELSWVDEQDSWSTAESLRRELSVAPARPVTPMQSGATQAPAQPASRPATVKQAPAARARGDVPRRWQLLAAAVGGNGPGSGAAAGLVFALSHDFSARFAIAAQLTAASALAMHELNAGRSVMTQSFDLAVLACLQLPVGARFELRACGGPEVGALVATGHGFEPNKSTLLGDVGGALRIDVRRELDSHWGIVAGALLHVGAAPPRIHYEQADNEVEAFRAARFVVQGVVGVSYAF